MATSTVHPPSLRVPVSVTPLSRLQRTLYVISLDPSRKFGSLEEQIFVQACAFNDRQSVFIPLFSAPFAQNVCEQYQNRGLEVAFLDLETFHFGTFRKLLALIREHHIEVVHWNMCSPTNRYRLALRLLAPRLTHYFTDHNSRTTSAIPSSFPKQQVKRFLLGGFARVFGVSQFVVESLRQQQTWPEASCLMHFINTERFAPDESVRAALRAQYGRTDQFVLLTVAHLIKDKGVDVVIRALQGVDARAHLWIVGDGPEETALKQLCQELALEERVHFLGLQQQVQPFLQAADCFVCPSLWAEAAGLVNLEALATALPVLASRIGGIPEYIQDGETGWLFPPGDAAALGELINRLVNDPTACASMGRQARRRAEERFSISARLEEYLGLYRTEN